MDFGQYLNEVYGGPKLKTTLSEIKKFNSDPASTAAVQEFNAWVNEVRLPTRLLPAEIYSHPTRDKKYDPSMPQVIVRLEKLGARSGRNQYIEDRILDGLLKMQRDDTLKYMPFQTYYDLMDKLRGRGYMKKV